MLYGILIPGLGGGELLLLFGRKLPEIGRMFGRTVVEVRRGLSGAEDEVHEPVRVQAPSVEKPSFEGVPAKV